MRAGESSPGSAEPADSNVTPASPAVLGGTAAPAPRRRELPWLEGVVALVVLASLAVPVTWTGLWDPHELEVAELGRRVAIHVFGARWLELSGVDNAPVTQGVLGRGELPFTSIALGFQLFGLQEWAGRLPLALWGVLGVAATYALVGRLCDRRAGAFSGAVLATTPLYFVQARWMLGEIVSFAGTAIACAGLGVTLFDRPRRVWVRPLALAAGLLGLFTGLLARGIFLGVAVPLLGVGLAWVVLRVNRAFWRDRFSDGIGGALVLGGVTSVALGLGAFAAAQQTGRYSMWLGFSIDRAASLPTFDVVLGNLAHALFPYSALIPFALGRLLLAPPLGEPEARQRETALRVLLLSVATSAYAAQALLAPYAQGVGYSAVFALAAALGVALRDYERGAPPSVTLVLGVAAFALLIVFDLRQFPERSLDAFNVGAAEFPESFARRGKQLLTLATLGFLLLFASAFAERPAPGARRFDLEEYLAWPRAIPQLWRGNLLFFLLVLEAALVGLAALGLLARLVPALGVWGGLWGELAVVAWVVPLAGVVGPPLLLLARDLCRGLYESSGTSRAVGALIAAVGCGLALSLGYYPALAAQLSPKEVFSAYRRLAHDAEPLGLLDVGAGSTSYYAGRDAPRFDEPVRAYEWLKAGGRRWLVMRNKHLAELNAAYRSDQPAEARRNLPVLDARSSEILLVSNQLLAGEQSSNPFDRWLLDTRPVPAHALGVDLGGQLEVLGWEIRDEAGASTDELTPGRRYEFWIYHHVQRPPSVEWQTFIHIDGHRRRHNGDHDTLRGEYPLRLWRPGDFVADAHEFVLEPNFGPGEYDVYLGLFSGNRRLEVKRGAHEDNRVQAGKIRVR